jgi:16S rRNA (cytidine1402-2'-O)-methyltransferase|tara:strand:+ start:545 stop:1225 length:681 start_codon:yes stop_codon:yes gene_type:complete
MSSLYIVSTPIGNLNDISKRAIEVLSSVEIICVEDTRVSKKLLNRYKISNKMIVYNNFNESRQCDKILDYLNQGKDVALISDAGTPCISDPGYLLVNSCRKNNIDVFSVPGPSSLIAALSISGLPTDAFYFEGFLPKKKGRKTKFEALILLKHTIIIFESPMRIIKTLEDIKKYFGAERIVSIHREITKMFEESYLGNINQAIDHFSSKKCRGEFVLIIAKEDYKI